MAPVPFPSACPAAPRPSWRSFRSPQRARQRRAHHGARSVPLSVPAAPIMASARGGERQALALPSRGGGSGGRAAMEPGESRPAVATTLRALNEALGRPAALWVKESGARNLRHRDFLAPRAALRAAFPGGQVPADVVAGVASVAGPGVLAVRGCEDTPAGLAVRVRRPEAFRRLLGPLPAPGPAPKGRTVLLHVPALRRPDAVPLRPSHLRPLLLADHLARLLRAQGVSVSPVPAVTQEGGREVLRQLRVEWPSGSGHSDLAGTVSALKQALGRSPWAAACEHGLGTSALPEDVICEVHLRGFMEQQDLVGYDPNLGVLHVTEGKLRSVAELQQAALQCMAGGQGSCCIVHVVSCEEEFQQQQLDLLWRILDPGAHTALQKHLVCGPVKVTNPSAPIEADQYFHLRVVLRGLEVRKEGPRSLPAVLPGAGAGCCSGVVSPCLHTLVDGPGVGVAPSQPKGRAFSVPNAAISSQPSPGSSTRAWLWCDFPCLAPGSFVSLFLGWVAVAARMP
ncbi:DALR anticodon-binding domain-containing protein 3 isoform X4 [Colius striatus]|uniref:DALR anticodon-binding domain-containing protein 3 isoform X4 n=1 Tax=Colius striatus TaxID=57412 RepID=UPI002B1E1C92|nr:DALR anticodon-binding domain-containing protein 3 isoform X4 [Colius striatus]